MGGDAASPLLAAKGIARSFPGVRALDDVDIDLRAGEVLAVVGENGAGKSTLMKILAGVDRPDAGSITLDGRPLHLRNVNDAIEAGIALIHQELNLAGNLDIAANICLGREPRTLGFIDHRRLHARARAALGSVGLDEPTERRVDDLTIGHRQLVEIAKALAIDARVLIMDEPTSSLSLNETERLFTVVRSLRDRGVGVIYISHRLAEVEAIADRVVVLRDGRVSGRLQRDAIEREAIVECMIGRAMRGHARQVRPVIGAPRLAVARLRTRRFPRAAVDLTVHAGEIVGIAGLVGAGRTELLEAIFGIDPALGGTVDVDGTRVAIRSPRGAIARGLALVPEDRGLHGLIIEQSVRRNVSLAAYARHASLGFVDRGHERVTSAGMTDHLGIRCAGDGQIAGTLSGGNQQKVVIGKWLAMQPRVLLLDEPTRGVDVGARSEIYRIMESLAAAGAAILFASSDLEEIIAMSDRVLVMCDGRVTGELASGSDEAAIMRLATGNEAGSGDAA